VVVLASRRTFDQFLFEPTAVRALMDEQGWAGTVTVVHVLPSTEHEEPGLVIEARNLFPVGNITEDPATGSAAASLGAYLRGIGVITPPLRFSVLQGRHIGRPSRLLVDVPAAGGVTVSGTAATIESAR
jgi:PhzF family phenazine biosynthesis protein